MSNLSDLLPSGAGGKSANFVASGTLANGQTVILRSDGKVEAVAGVTGSTGSITQFESGQVTSTGSCYDTGQDKILVCYSDNGNSGYMTLVVGTLTANNGLSFGLPFVPLSEGSNYCIAVFDPSTGKSLVGGQATSSSYSGAFFAATISGTTPSVGAKATLFAGLQYTCGVYNTTAQKILVAGNENGNNNYGAAAVATISGTSVGFGGKLTFLSDDVREFDMAYNPVSNNNICVFYRQSNSYGQFAVLLVSGTSVSVDSIYSFATTATRYPAIGYDVNTARMLIAYQNSSSSGHLWYRAMSFSGNAPTQGTAAVLVAATGGYTSNAVRLIYSPTEAKLVIVYGGLYSQNPAYAKLTISGTTATLGTPVTFGPFPNNGFAFCSLAYNPDLENLFAAFYADPSVGKAIAFNFTSTNSSSFVGITEAAIANTATGTVTLQGGINASVTGLTIGSTYYVQVDGTLGTGSTSIEAGEALSATSINLVNT